MRRRFHFRRLLLAGDLVDQTLRAFVSSGLKRLDGRDSVRCRRRGIERHDRGARLPERLGGPGVGFLRERRLDGAQRLRIARLEHRLGRGDAFGGVGIG